MHGATIKMVKHSVPISSRGVLVVDFFYPFPFVASVEKHWSVTWLILGIVYIMKKRGAFCGNQIRHHDAFPATKSFVECS